MNAGDVLGNWLDDFRYMTRTTDLGILTCDPDVGQDQDRFLEAFGAKVLPELASLHRGPALVDVTNTDPAAVKQQQHQQRVGCGRRRGEKDAAEHDYQMS